MNKITALMFLLLSSGAFAETPEKLQIEMLDVGQGLSFLITSPKCATLYDTGFAEAGIDTMLANRNIDTLCSVIISHWHRDHAEGLNLLIEMARKQKLAIKRLVVSSDYKLKGYQAKMREAIYSAFAEMEIPVCEVSRSDTIWDFMPFSARVLWPQAGDSSATENAASMALHLSDGKKGFLFTGDLGHKQEYAIMDMEPDLKAHFLQIGHHGSRNSSALKFLEQIQPQTVFISAGKGNAYKHPHGKTLANLKSVMQDTAQILRTDILNCVKIDWVYGE